MTPPFESATDSRQSQSDRNCPHCETAMRAVAYEGVEIEVCPSCSGAFLDHDELGKIVQARQVKFDPQELQAIANATPTTGLPVQELDRQVICPKCSQTMKPINYGNDSGIIIDRCVTCSGFWLDRSELERVQMVVEGWDNRLPQVMKDLEPQLKQVSTAVDQIGHVTPSGLPLVGRFINCLINGMIDLSG